MDSKDLALLLTALHRIGEELHQANVLATIGAPAPNVELSFTAYADFDPASIGAKGVAKDKYGWTQLEWGMRSFYRRRSSEDDEKGNAIRFSRCISGTVQDKNQTWETLVRFRDRRPAKKLTEEQAERMAAVHPPQPAQSKATAVAVPVAPTTPIPPPPVVTVTATQVPAQAGDPFARWSDMRKRIAAAELPEWLMLAEGDSVAVIEQRIQALTEFAAIPVEAQAKLILLSNEHQALVAKARSMQMALSSDLAVLPPNARSIEVGAAISTLTNLIAAENRKRNTSAAPTVNQTGAPAQPATQPVTQPALGQGGAPQTGGARTAAQFREWFEKSAKANAGQARVASDAVRQNVWLTLRNTAGDETRMHGVLRALCGDESYKNVSSARVYALQAWLKPTGQGKATYLQAAAEIDALLADAGEPEVQS